MSFHGESQVICFNQSYLTSSLSASCIRAIAFSCFSSIFFSPIFLNIMSVLNMYFFPDLVLDFGEMKQLHSYLIINFLLHARYSQKFQITYKSCSPSCSLWWLNKMAIPVSGLILQMIFSFSAQYFPFSSYESK